MAPPIRDVVKDAWIERVLGVTLPQSATNAGSANAGLGAMATLWRKARTDAESHLSGFMAAFLADPEVKSDPRLETVRHTMTRLPALLASFDDGLAERLEAAAQNGGARDEAREALTRCRKTLAGAERLAWIERFAARATAGAFPMHSALADALTAIATELDRNTSA